MKKASQRIIALVAGIFVVGVSAIAFAMTVRYKPYGVPDDRREEYDQVMAGFEQRDQLVAHWKNRPKPIVEVPIKSHRFGLVEPGTTQTHRFIIRNRGEEPLSIEWKANEGELATIALDQSTAAPGEAVTATFTWNVGNRPGPQEQRATLITSDPLAGDIKLKVSGTVRTELILPSEVSLPPTDPAEPARTEFVVGSQLWDELKVVDVSSDLELFEWYAEPVGTDQLEGDQVTGTKTAWKVVVSSTPMNFGRFNGTLRLTIQPPDGDPLVREIRCVGRVRSPIVFQSPDIHMSDGLDIGTLQSGQEHNFHLLVRQRGVIEDRQIKVLEVKPDQLRASLEPTDEPGVHRLTVTIPEDCPMTVFNIEEKHGYVYVGDPDNKQYTGWFPLYGAVIGPDVQ